MMPLSLFLFGLAVISVFGLLILIKSSFYDTKQLNKGDIYLRVTLFLISLFFSLSTTGGVYLNDPAVLAFDSYWAIVPFSIAVVSLFATIYAWLTVFGKRKEGEI